MLSLASGNTFDRLLSLTHGGASTLPCLNQLLTLFYTEGLAEQRLKVVLRSDLAIKKPKEQKRANFRKYTTRYPNVIDGHKNGFPEMWRREPFHLHVKTTD